MNLLETIKAKLLMLDPLQNQLEEHEEEKADRASIERVRGPRVFGILLDYSGSMLHTDIMPSRILAACQACCSVVEMLRQRSPESYIFIGTFADGFHLCCPPLQAGKEAKRILAGMADLGEVGNTYIDHGIRGMLGVMKHDCPLGLPVTILILTDGCQSGSKRSVISAGEEIRQAGADVWAVGIGGNSNNDVDEDLLRKVVSRPGQYSFIGSWRGAEAIIGEFQHVIGIYLHEEEE